MVRMDDRCAERRLPPLPADGQRSAPGARLWHRPGSCWTAGRVPVTPGDLSGYRRRRRRDPGLAIVGTFDPDRIPAPFRSPVRGPLRLRTPAPPQQCVDTDRRRAHQGGRQRRNTAIMARLTLPPGRFSFTLVKPENNDHVVGRHCTGSAVPQRCSGNAESPHWSYRSRSSARGRPPRSSRRQRDRRP